MVIFTEGLDILAEFCLMSSTWMPTSSPLGFSFCSSYALSLFKERVEVSKISFWSPYVFYPSFDFYSAILGDFFFYVFTYFGLLLERPCDFSLVWIRSVFSLIDIVLKLNAFGEVLGCSPLLFALSRIKSSSNSRLILNLLYFCSLWSFW